MSHTLCAQWPHFAPELDSADTELFHYTEIVLYDTASGNAVANAC